MYTITEKTVKGYKGRRPITMHVFDSPEELAEYHSGIDKAWDASYDKHWGGGVSADCAKVLVNGDTSNLAKAQEILDKLEVSDLLTNNITVLENAVAGFVPNVAAYIAGQPETMFDLQQQEQPNVNAPIRVFIETTVSSGISHQQLLARGIATLAFVMAMNTIRPVELYTISAVMDNNRSATYGYAVKLASHPLDLARAVWMLTSPGFARAIMFSTCSHMSKTMCTFGPWPFNSDPTKDEYVDMMRRTFDMQPEDIYIKGGYLFDHDMLNDPIKWVNDMVKQHSVEV